MQLNIARTTLILMFFCFYVCVSSTAITCGQSQCISGDQCCSDLNSGFRCYNPQFHECVNNEAGATVLCGTGESACSNFCYNRDSYCCMDGRLIERQFCESQGTTSGGSTTTSGESTTTTGGQPNPNPNPVQCGSAENHCYITGDLCCNDFRAGFTCYSPQTHACQENQNGQNVLCPLGHSACSDACYNATQYCCTDGGLQQLQFCEPSQGTTGSQSTTGSGSTTGGQGTTGAGTTTGGQQVQCGSEACLAGQQCCGTQCFDPQQKTCFATTYGQAVQTYEILCPVGHAPCGLNCYDPDTHICQRSVMDPPAIVERPAPTVTCGNSTCAQNQECCQPTLYYTTALPVCYDPRTQVCAVYNYVTTGQVCSILANGFAEQACEVGSSGSPTRPQFVGHCFDPTLQFCCINVSPGGTSTRLCDDASLCTNCRCTNHC